MRGDRKAASNKAGDDDDSDGTPDGEASSDTSAGMLYTHQ